METVDVVVLGSGGAGTYGGPGGTLGPGMTFGSLAGRHAASAGRVD